MAEFVTVGQISVWKQSLDAEEVLMSTSNHDWCLHTQIHRARVGSALHQKCDHSNTAVSGSEVKWSEVTFASKCHVGSGLHKLSTNSDMPVENSRKQR
jgi:hypothetical protein